MQHHLALVRRGAMFPEIDALPRAKHQFPLDNGNRKLGLGQGGADMGRHVVRPLNVMHVASTPVGGETGEEAFEIGAHVGIGILLHQQRAGGVPAPDREQAGGDAAPAGKTAQRRGDLEEAAAVRGDGEGFHDLKHGVSPGVRRRFHDGTPTMAGMLHPNGQVAPWPHLPPSIARYHSPSRCLLRPARGATLPVWKRHKPSS
ncbi:protein of unknown function [Rhodovastum atsumiense]|nr:protein of unknown function [Rhodovastum atsumiense]